MCRLRGGRAQTERGGFEEGGIRSQGGPGAGECERNERDGGSSQGVIGASAHPRARVSPARVPATPGSAVQVSAMFWEALLGGGGTGEGAEGVALGEAALGEVGGRNKSYGGAQCEREESEERVCEKRVCRGGKAERFEQDAEKEAWMEIGGTGDMVRGRQRAADIPTAPGVACTRGNGGAAARAVAFEAPRTAAAALEESPEAVEIGRGAASVEGDVVGSGGSGGSARVTLSQVADVSGMAVVKRVRGSAGDRLGAGGDGGGGGAAAAAASASAAGVGLGPGWQAWPDDCAETIAMA
ncbi:unnamed protein product [Closterium sp. NIES-64]|nr:unnamed protein product [Closterium sp. NIES-65]CAI5985655.1 unnamed protein product [Closterium sp. NIES-64]